MATAIQDFLKSAPHGAAQVLQLLAAAESLTDDVACEIYEVAPIKDLSADLFVKALHYADFIAPRNSEWSFVPDVRRELQTLRDADPNDVVTVHRALIALGAEGDETRAGSSIPGYLFTKAGRAYHLAALGEPNEALALYGKAAEGPLTGAQWLASKLAEEQEEAGIIPAGNVESTFLRAMVLFREGNRDRAEPLFRVVAKTDQQRSEVAIAMHILGNYIGRTDPREAERLYRRSIEIGDEISSRHHVAQTLHSLANLIGRDRKRSKEAEGLYRRSIEILEGLGDRNGVAQTLHSLANLTGRDRNRSKEAEGLYRRSIEILEGLGDRNGVAQTLHSLANLIGRDRNRSKEAEGLYRRSIEIGEEIGNRHHVAQTLHSLANVIRNDASRRSEAEQLLQESLRIGKQLSNLRHQAQVLRTLSFVLEYRSPAEAKELLEQSLELNQRAHDRRGQELVKKSLARLRERFDL